jgi:anti-anti-sigma factor
MDAMGTIGRTSDLVLGGRSLAAFACPLALLGVLDEADTLLLVLLPILLLALLNRERQRLRAHRDELQEAYHGMTRLLADMIQEDDEYTGEHSRSVVSLSLQVGDKLGLNPRQRRRTEFAALLHDLGKTSVSKEIINKPGPLDAKEWMLVKLHTIQGQRMLQHVGGFLQEVGDVVRSTHERWDGGGYPDGLAGKGIPIEARVISCCDAFNAMTSDRSYRRALPLEAAVSDLRAKSGTQFDPEVTIALLGVLATEGVLVAKTAWGGDRIRGMHLRSVPHAGDEPALGGLTVREDNGIVVARMRGDIDLSNATAIREHVLGTVSNTALGLVVDLTSTRYVDTAGVNLLLELAERLGTRQQELRLVVPQKGGVRRILDLIGAEKLFKTTRSVELAQEDIRARASLAEQRQVAQLPF